MKEMVVEKTVVCCLLLIVGPEANHRTVLGAEPPKTAGAALRYENPKHLAGAIYAPRTKQLLFKFKRVANRSGTTLNVERDFTYPDGKLAAREHVLYEDDALISYELDEVQIGASGRATIQRTAGDPGQGSIEFQYSRQSAHQPELRTEALRKNTLTADMVGPFLAAHWEALQRGEKVKCRYIVVPRAETVGFTFIKEADSHSAPNTATVKMEASTPFASALVAPLLFTIEAAPPHRVLQYVGRSTPKIKTKGKWKDLDAVTVFDWQSAG